MVLCLHLMARSTRNKTLPDGQLAAEAFKAAEDAQYRLQLAEAAAKQLERERDDRIGAAYHFGWPHESLTVLAGSTISRFSIMKIVKAFDERNGIQP